MQWADHLHNRMYKTSVSASRFIHLSNEYAQAGKEHRDGLHTLIRRELLIMLRRMLKLYCMMLLYRKAVDGEQYQEMMTSIR